jgi:2-iminoacetate synthase
MDQAKPGAIQELCAPNALLTFREYLLDYASEETQRLGENSLTRHLKEIANKRIREETAKRLLEIEGGKRDLFF